MLKTFRAKLMLLVVATLITLVAVVAGGMWLGIEQSRDLDDIERKLIPQLELGPQMEAGFDKLARSIQEAVAAQDGDALDDTEHVKKQLLQVLAARGGSLSAAEHKTLRDAISDYYTMARGVAARLIGGDESEALVEQIPQMQAKQANTAALIRRITTVDRRELAAGFSVVRDGHRRADRYRLAIGVCGFLFAFGLATWVYRGLLPALAALSSGFSRFATGDFSRPIPLLSHDEVGNLAREANQMAESLRKLGEQRDRHDWIKTGQAGLADELQGEIEPQAVADRTLKFLARHMHALAGAFYVTNEDGSLALLGQYAHTASASNDGLSAVPGFRVGEGLVGQAAAGDELFVIDDPPGDYVKIRSGLGDAVPRTLILAPIAHGGKTVAVIELALLVSCSEDARELLGSVRRTLGIVLEAAKSRAAERELLERTMRQAQRLTVQEEELRLNNQELQAQREQLQRANDELEAQRAALSEQNRELESAREHLQQQANELGTISTYKSQFLSNMSHELLAGNSNDIAVGSCKRLQHF
jgi:HAMP domain-containing protein